MEIGIILAVIAIILTQLRAYNQSKTNKFLEGEAEAAEHGFKALMEDFTNYLHTSPNIVAIPTIRLVIIDLLLLLSRLLVSLNPDEKNPKKGFSSAESLSTEEQEDKLIQIRKQYDELVEPTIERVWDCIKSTKNRLEFDIGEERLFDLKTIIDDLDKSKWKKNKELVSKFTIYKSDGRRDIQEATTARNMGIKIQNLLKKLTNEREEIELYFPIRMILDGTLGRERR